MKNKVYKEKENRDIQLNDEKKRKKNEKKKERQFDKELGKIKSNNLVSRLISEMDKEKQVIQTRKYQDKEHLIKTLLENEVNKKKQSENLLKEKEEDVQLCVEYAKVLDKQEKDRENYFKNKEMKANDFSKQMAETVIKEMDDKTKREEECIRRYQHEKELK